MRFILPKDFQIDAFVARVGAKYDLQIDSENRLSRQYYDTFDWRLQEKHIALFKEKEGMVVVDQRRDRTRQIEGVIDNQGNLPAGAAADEVRGAVGIRRLLPMADVRGKVTRYRALNKNEKTVVYVEFEELNYVHAHRSQHLGAFAHVKAVRGYNKECKWLQATLENEGAVLHEPMHVLAARSAGIHIPAARKGWPISPAMSVQQAAYFIMSDLIASMRLNEPGIIDDLDSEFLHDYRVAVRRLRSLIAAVKPVFPAEVLRTLTDDFRDIGRRTNRLRDVDVYLLKKTKYFRRVSKESQQGLEQFFTNLQKERIDLWQDVCRWLKSRAYRNRVNRWQRFLGEPPVGFPAAAHENVRTYASRAIDKQFRRVIKDGNKIDDKTPDAALHKLRIDCKKLRYRLEFFAALYDSKKMHTLITQLKRLQDNLGDFNDIHVQQQDLSGYREELAEADIEARAIAELVHTLREEQRQVRDHFAETFSGFASKRNHKLLQQVLAT